MTHEEFTKISGQEISFKDYESIVEPMYMNSNMDKETFCKFITPSVKPLAKKYKEEQDRKHQKLVFISDGSRTPNGCYAIGQWMMLLKMEVNIKTGKITYTVRETNHDEMWEHGKYWDEWLGSDSDIRTDDPRVKIIIKK